MDPVGIDAAPHHREWRKSGNRGQPFLLSANRRQLIHLSQELTIQECGESREQFLCVVTTLKKGLEFQRRRKGPEMPGFGTDPTRVRVSIWTS
jgi:hypothetical protein